MQALALKYRPKSFYELIGQDAIKENLISALDSGRLGHAYLFSGLRGSGKTSSARIFAKDLLCQKGISSHACETCENCVAANEGRHIDIIEMDAASHRKIEDIRDLNEQTRYAPISGRFKIFIIDEAHMLTKEASNAFLKTLEEPPPYIKFILATTDPLKLPATILSRTQHFRFKAIANEKIIKHLEEILAKENVSFETNALRIISRCGSGSLRDTLTLLDQAIITCNANITTSAVTDMLGLLDPAKTEEILSVVARGDKDELCAVIKSLATNDAEMIINELIENLKEKFVSYNAPFSLYIFERFFKILSEAKNMLAGGSDPAFVLYITLFEMRECFNISGQNALHLEPNFMPQAQSFTRQPNFTSQQPNFAPQILENSENSKSENSEISAAKFSENSKPENSENSAPVASAAEFSENSNILENSENSAANILENSENSKPENSAAKFSENSENSSKDDSRYNYFLSLIYERSYDLGEVFKNFIEFSGFDGEQITLISSAAGIDAQSLRKSSALIREFAQKAFGSDKIKVEKKELKPHEMVEILLDQNARAMLFEQKNAQENEIKNEIKNLDFAYNSQPNKQPSEQPNSQPENKKNLSADANIGELGSLFGEPQIIKD